MAQINESTQSVPAQHYHNMYQWVVLHLDEVVNIITLYGDSSPQYHSFINKGFQYNNGSTDLAMCRKLINAEIKRRHI